MACEDDCESMECTNENQKEMLNIVVVGATIHMCSTYWCC